MAHLINSDGVIEIDRSVFGPPSIHASEYSCERILGSGSSGDVWEGDCRGATVAIKKLKKQTLSLSDLTSFKKEVEVCSRLAHPNILLFMGACTEEGELAIITELCKKGNLEDILHCKDVSLSLTRRLIMAKEIATGMAWLHGSDPQIIHRDLKPANILVDNDGHIKICDFGLSAIKPSQGTIKDGTHIPGSLIWMAPEVLQGKKLTEKIDVYSFSIVLWELVTMKYPFDEYQCHKKFIRDICQNDVRLPLEDIKHESIRKLLQRCWHKDPKKRPNFEEIIVAIDYVLIHCAIHCDQGKDFWLEKFFGRINIPFSEFCDQLCDFAGLTLPAECTPFLQLILSTEYSDGIMEPITVVNMEHFGDFLLSYGPIEVAEAGSRYLNVFERVLSICTCPWFHGNITKKQAEERLRDAGDFLVRTSSQPGFFTISRISENNRVSHIRVEYRQTEGCYIRLDSNYVKIADQLPDTIEALSSRLGLRRVAKGPSCRAIVYGYSKATGGYENAPNSYFPEDT